MLKKKEKVKVDFGVQKMASYLHHTAQPFTFAAFNLPEIKYSNEII